MVIYLFTLFIFIFNNLFYKNKLIRDWSKSIEGGGPEQRGGGS